MLEDLWESISRAERREFSRGAKIRFTVSPTLQAIVHVKTG
jgi:hypothetical protein